MRFSAPTGRAGVAGNFFWNAGYSTGPTTYDVDNGVIAPLMFTTIIGNAP